MAIMIERPPVPEADEPASRKVYIQGSRPDIRVPMREIHLSPSAAGYGGGDNAPVCVYDTSGPYADPDVVTNSRHGLKPLRLPWILERGDVEEYDGRDVLPLDNGYKPNDPRANQAVFPGLRRKTLRGKGGRAVTQMHYARQGIVTPEMEYIAIREGLAPEFVRHEV
ncbi:MAG TPA: phosphomethylpyrimidine synthase ThiC, partial [Chloroflexota bacterium]|nr:phosphomethylpyrimidine synthase ThiC [Chloroflexota bacterium]